MEDYTIIPVTSPSTVPAVATAFERAARQTDTFWEMQARYGPSPPYDALLEVLKASVEDPNHHVLQVVHNPTGEVVGMAQWKAPCWIEVGKVDPFKQEGGEKLMVERVVGKSVAPLSPVEKEPNDLRKRAGSVMVEDAARQIWNSYITHVRGKRHVFLGRLGVDPDHQRKGIGARLMQWGTDFADAQGLVAWLNGRPAALKLYESCGFEAVQVTHFRFDDLEVAPVTSMLRKPVPGRKVTS